MKQGEEVFRPYARLITILGDQLITNKIVAVNEIVKNSYDADATRVTVRFINFKNWDKESNQLPESEQPCIEIEDNGVGMSLQTITDVWLRPATPNKLLGKSKKGNLRITPKGRIMQGEKGIGRFAVHKLGDDINIFTKAKGQKEVQLSIDFKQYSAEGQIGLFDSNETDFKFLDEIKNRWAVNDSPKRITKESGTLIHVKILRENWSNSDFIKLEKSFKNLITPTIPEEDKNELGLNIKLVKDFDIEIFAEEYKTSTQNIDLSFEKMAENAPFKFLGRINQKGEINYKYRYNLDGSRDKEERFNFFDNYKPIKLNSIDERFYQNKELIRDPICGSFYFALYAYDFRNKAKWRIRTDQKDFILNHNVFLYRDGIRVYPYGDASNDWLELGKRRAEERAGWYFSNKELMGVVFISQNENNRLKDATNREGIMDYEGAFEDFRALLIAAIQVMKFEADIDIAKSIAKKQAPLQRIQSNLDSDFKKLVKRLDSFEDKQTIDLANKYLKSSKNYIEEMNKRTEIYEDLAGLGLAVEKSSHDTLSLLNKMNANIADLVKRLKKQEVSNDELVTLVSDIRDNLIFLYEQLQIIEPLLRYQKRQEKEINVTEFAEKVKRYFNYELTSYNIKVTIETVSEMNLNTGAGLILQILINLMDNSVYWLKTKNKSDLKEITIRINGDNSEILFADNGPGFEEEAIPYIFLEFFTRKPKDIGRGLGLFIVKEILDRLDASIEVIQSESKKILKGANFLIKF